MEVGRRMGMLAGLVGALIGGGWQVVTRQAAGVSLAPLDLALLRYGVPAIVLLPIVWRLGLLPSRVPRRLLLVVLCGAGLPFGLLAITGACFAPTSHMGVIMAGSSPAIGALLAWLLWREVPDRHRGIGMCLMTAGVLMLAYQSLSNWSSATWLGDALFLCAATLWAGYMLAFRRTGLTPWEGVALIAAWSTLGLVVVGVWRGYGSWQSIQASDVAWQFLYQGVIAGLLGTWCVGTSIRALGATQAASFGALVPAVSALGGWWFLGDPLGLTEVAAVALAVAGVGLASGAFGTGGPK